MSQNNLNENSQKARLRSVRILFAAIMTVFAVAAVCMIIFFIRRDTPEKAIRRTMKQITSMDDSAISQMVTSGEESLQRDVSPDAFHRFFNDFSCKILSVTENSQHATAQVIVTTPDARALASDIRLSLLRETESETPVSGDQVYTLLDHFLSENEYPLTETTGTITLTRQKNGWTIVSDSELTSLLLGSLPEALSDAYLLTPEQVLGVYLDRIGSLSGSEWIETFNIHDLFATYWADASTIDTEFVAKAAEAFAYSVNGADTSGNHSEVRVTITGTDTSAILTSYKQKLSEYADTIEAISSDTQAVSEKSARLLLESIRENESTADFTISVPMKNDGNGWIITDSSSLTDALFGGMSEAVEQFSAGADKES